METTTNPKEMYTEEEYLSRISYLNRLYGKLTPKKKNVMKQFMAENDMAAVGEVLDYLQELAAQ
jgi:hypothetical protein